MSRFRFVAAALAALAFAGPAAAQTPAPSHVQAAREVMDLTGITQGFGAIFTEFDGNTRQLVTQTRPDMLKDMEAVLEILKVEAEQRRNEFANSAAEVFARRMVEADLREVAQFFRSAVGQRYAQLRNQAMEDMFQLMQPWSLQVSNLLFDRFAEEMRKRGHKL